MICAKALSSLIIKAGAIGDIDVGGILLSIIYY